MMVERYRDGVPDDGSEGFVDDRPPSKSSRKRAAHAAQELGERLIALREKDLAELPLPEILADAIRLARRLKSHGGLSRQRQYISKLMRDIDTAPIEAALASGSRDSAQETERFRRLEVWRDRLLAEGETALADLEAFRGNIDHALLARLVARARAAEPGSPARTLAARELFKALRSQLETAGEPGTPPAALR